MDSEERIFLAALEKPARQRISFLNEACGADWELRRRVELLLKSHAEAGSFLLNDPSSLDAHEEVASDLIQELAEQVGSTIGRYKLLEQIGEGGFGVVYMAEQSDPVSRRVALKIIKLGMDTKQVIARFEAERQALALMDHPNIAKVLDAGATETGRPYFVMELVRGKSITKFCDDNQVNVEERLRLFAGVCRGIQHAHQKGIIHRDIKPNNVIVTWHDEEAVPKVIDFGVAKATEQRLTEKTLFTRYSQMIGTPTYMSPEQAKMGTDVDTRSDIYSLGVLLYELLTGAPPFETKQLLTAGYDEMRRRICEDEPLTPSARLGTLNDVELSSLANQRRVEPAKLNRLFRGELDWIVGKAMEKDRRRRYESAGSFASDVRRYLNGEPVAAVAPSVTYRLQKHLQRNMVAIATISVVVVALLLGTIVSTWQAIRATRQTIRAEKSEMATRRHLYASEMATAQREFSDLNTQRTLELLTKYLPQPGEPDLRGFEWRWLWNQCHQEGFQLHGHTQLLRDLRFSPDGQWLASGSKDGSARLWNVETRQQIWSFAVGTHCNGVDFSPDGKLLITSFYGPDELVTILWDTSDPRSPAEVRRFNFGGKPRFSPDGQLISGGGRHFDLKGNLVQELSDMGRAWGQDFSNDGTTFAMLDWKGNGGIWKLPSGKLLTKLSGHQGFIDVRAPGVAISPTDANLIATTSALGTRIWNEKGDAVTHLLGSGATPQSMVDFSADGTLLAVRQYFGAIRIFDTANWTEIATCRTPAEGNTLAFSPTEADLLVYGGDDGVIRGWKVKPTDSVLEHPDTVVSLEFAPQGDLLAVGLENGAVWFWDTKLKTLRFKTPKTRTSYSPLFFASSFIGDFVAFSSDGTHAAVIGPEDSVTLWNLETEDLVVTLSHPHHRNYTSVTFGRNDNYLYAGTIEGSEPSQYEFKDSGVHVWSWATGESKFIGKLDHPGYGVKSLAVSPNASILASGQVAVGTTWTPVSVRLWDTETLELVQSIELPDHIHSGAFSLEFSHDASTLAIGDGHWGTLLWDLNTSRFRSLPHKNAVLHVSFSPNCERLVSADGGGLTKLWDVSTNQAIVEFVGRAAEFSPDGTQLAVGGQGLPWLPDRQQNGSVTLHDAPSLEDIDRLSRATITR